EALRIALGDPVVEPSVDAGVAADAPDAAAPRTGDDVVVTATGSGVRRQRRGEPAFGALGPGEEGASPGDTLDVPKGGRARVRRPEQEIDLVGPGRYVVEKEALVRVVRGRAEIDGATADVAIHVKGGTIVARGGEKTRAKLDVAPAHGATV